VCLGQNGFRKSQLIRPDSEQGEPYILFDQLNERNTMVQSNIVFEEPYILFDQLNERNTMVQSNIAFEELSQTSLAGSG
jgi:hypothetical protein